MDIKVGDYVTLRSWEEVKDGNTLNLDERIWNHLRKEPRKILEIDYNPRYDEPLAYLIEDKFNDRSWFVLESAIASVRRDFK